MLLYKITLVIKSFRAKSSRFKLQCQEIGKLLGLISWERVKRNQLSSRFGNKVSNPVSTNLKICFIIILRSVRSCLTTIISKGKKNSTTSLRVIIHFADRSSSHSLPSSRCIRLNSGWPKRTKWTNVTWGLKTSLPWVFNATQEWWSNKIDSYLEV